MKTDNHQFTAQQLADFREYEEVRQMGALNMFSPQAREATGLSREAYLFVMENYSELRAANEKR